MKIGIFDEYLAAMGGGEKHLGALAEWLSKKDNYQVDIITPRRVDLAELSEKLRIDLSRCHEVVCDAQESVVETLSEQYDVFINGTHFSTLKPRAKRNLMLMFFPLKPPLALLFKIPGVGKLLRALDRWENVKLVSGFEHRMKVGKYFSRKFGHWTSGKFTLLVESPRAETLLVEIQHLKGQHRMKYSARVGVNQVVVEVPAGERWFVRAITARPARMWSGRRVQNLIFRVSAPFRMYNNLPYYDLIFSNSCYTHNWLKRIWGRESEILYPPVDTEVFKYQREKKNIILSVGRFFQANHNKKQLEMVQIFRRAVSAGKLAGWEFHVCGGVDEKTATSFAKEYFTEVQKAAAGCPQIHLHPNIKFPDLLRLYGEASIFWHATGYEEDDRRHPDKFEHFGITTVEAMAAGCIPVVIGKAGQLEIVDNGKNGFLWTGEPELIEKTLEAAKMMPARQTKMRQLAISRAQMFSREEFDSNLEKLWAKYITGTKNI